MKSTRFITKKVLRNKKQKQETEKKVAMINLVDLAKQYFEINSEDQLTSDLIDRAVSNLSLKITSITDVDEIDTHITIMKIHESILRKELSRLQKEIVNEVCDLHRIEGQKFVECDNEGYDLVRGGKKKFVERNMASCDFSKASHLIIKNADFVKCDLSSSKFDKISFENCVFTSCDFKNSNFPSVKFENVKFIKTDLSEVDFEIQYAEDLEFNMDLAVYEKDAKLQFSETFFIDYVKFSSEENLKNLVNAIFSVDIEKVDKNIFTWIEEIQDKKKMEIFKGAVKNKFNNIGLLKFNKIKDVFFPKEEQKVTWVVDCFVARQKELQQEQGKAQAIFLEQEYVKQFKKIYKALYASQTGWKSKEKDLSNIKTMEKIHQEIEKAGKHSRMQKALELTEGFFKNHSDIKSRNDNLVKEIYRYGIKHSHCGFFARSRATGKTLYTSAAVENALKNNGEVSDLEGNTRSGKIFNALGLSKKS